MEVMMPLPARDFLSYDNTCTSLYAFAPENLQDSGNRFFNGSTSPTNSSTVFRRQLSFSTSGCYGPWNLEENHELSTNSNEDFTFDIGGQLVITPPLSADELFDRGKIKALEPPQSSPKKLDFASIKELIRGEKYIDSSEEIIMETRRDDILLEGNDLHKSGRERVYYSSRSRKQKLSDSLSTLTVSNMVSKSVNNVRNSRQPSSLNSSLNSSSSSSWYGKWKLMDVFLFRNASEGHEINKKYGRFRKVTAQNEDVIKNSSFRSSVGRKKGKVSAHEHYKVNRAATEEMRRKTFLPYKKSLISCMDMYANVHF